MHSVCRSCIIRYLESSDTCPVCDVPLHQTNPLLGIRSDKTLQTLLYKLVPGVYKDEVRRRCTVINNAHADGKKPASSSALARLLKDICDMTTGGRIYTGDETFSVCLQYSPSKQSTSSANSFKDLCSIDTGKTSCEMMKQDLTDCSYLLCPASLTVAHLKKLIRSKLELGSDLPLELYHSSRDGSLYDGYTMADVAYITAWTSVKPLHFYYCVHAKGSRNPNETTPERNNPDKIQTPYSKSAIRTEQKRRKYFGPLSGTAKGKLSTASRVKPPPGKCLSTKRLAVRNVFPSTKSLPKEKKGVTQQERSSHSLWMPECVTKPNDVACEEEEEDCVILLEEDTLDSYPVQTDSGPAGDVVGEGAEVQETNVKRAFSAIAPDVGTSANKCVETECRNSADSALSPNRSDVVTQSTLTSDSCDMTTTTTSSDVETSDVIDSATSPLPPPKKKMKTSEIAGAVERNLFAVINSMIVATTDNNNSNNNRNNNDNVVSSSTSSSQVSIDDGGDCGASKTSVETQTSVKLVMSRKAKPNKLRSKKATTLSKPRNKNAEDANAEIQIQHPSASIPAEVAAVSASAHTSSGQQHISLSAHTFSSAAAVTPCTSTTLCVPICIGDKGSNLILNLPQNVSVQCRIRSDKILIASNPTAGNPDTVTTFGSIAGSETLDAGKEGTALVPVHPTAPSTFPSTEGTSLLTCSLPKCTDDAGTGLVGTGTTVEDTSKERSRTKSIGADLLEHGTCGHKQISSNHTEYCQVPSDTTSDKGLSRDQDTNTSASLSRNVSLSCNAGSHGNAMATSSGHSFCSATATRQPTSLSSKSVLINSVKPRLDVAAKPSTPYPAKTDLQKSVPKQKPVQSVLPNVAKIATSTANPPIITPNAVDTPSTSTNKVVLFKPYQMANTTSETKSHKTEVPTGSAGIQHNRQSTCASYRSPQCTAYPGFTRPTCTQDEEDKQPHLSKDPGSVDQKGLNPAVHCTAGNVPFRNIIKVPVYTTSCSQANRKPERKSTAGSKFNQSSKDKGSVYHGQEIPKDFEHIKKTSPVTTVTSVGANSVTKTETKEQRTPIRSSLSVDLKLPPTSRSSEIVEGDGGVGANLADASQSTSRKAQSLKRQHQEHPTATPKSPRRRSEKFSALDEMTYTRAEADSGTSPSTATGSPPSSKNDEKKTGSQHHHHHHHHHRSSKDDGSPVRRTLVIDLERCSQGRPPPSECISSRKKSSSSMVESRLQCCSPTTTTTLQQRPGNLSRPASYTPPTKLVISLPRCQVSPTQSPPSSSAGNDSPPTTTKRLKLMCNGMTIYRTLESPGSRSASASGGGGGGGGGSSGGATRKSPVSAPILECSSSKPSLFSSPKTPAQGKHRPKAVEHGEPAAPVMVGVLPGSAVASVDSTSTSPRSVEVAASVAGNSVAYTAPHWKGLERSVSLPDPGSTEEPLELTTKVVKERQKEKEYERFMSSQQPTSAFTA